MKKKTVAAALLCMTAISGCSRGGGEPFDPQETSLYLTSEGTVTSATVESYEADSYSAEELKAYVEEALAVFNAAASEDKTDENNLTSLQECTMENGTARVLIEFPSSEEYLRFSELYPEENGALKSLDIVSVPDGVTKGYLVGVSFVDAEGASVPYDEITKQNKLFVAAVEGPANIATDGTLRYVSEGVTLEGGLCRTPEEGISYLVFQ